MNDKNKQKQDQEVTSDDQQMKGQLGGMQEQTQEDQSSETIDQNQGNTDDVGEVAYFEEDVAVTEDDLSDDMS